MPRFEQRATGIPPGPCVKNEGRRRFNAKNADCRLSVCRKRRYPADKKTMNTWERLVQRLQEIERARLAEDSTDAEQTPDAAQPEAGESAAMNEFSQEGGDPGPQPRA